MTKGSKHSIETRAKMKNSYHVFSIKNGHPLSKNRFVWTGRKLSKSHTEAMSRGQKGIALGRKLSEEHKAKISLANIGNFKIKDRTKLKTDRLKMYDTQYKYWMLSVKNRDNWKCKIKNSECSGRLEAHHILPWKDFPELRYDTNNGISLCKHHHPRKADKVASLSPFFQELIKENHE